MASERLLAALLMSTAQVVGTSLVLGTAFSLLYRGPMVVLNLAIAFALLSTAVLRKQLVAGIREMIAITVGGYRFIRGSNVLILLSILSAVVVIWTLFLIWTFPAVEWDALTYHLPDVAFFNQYHAIKEAVGPMDPVMWMNGYPKNIEILYYWIFAITKKDTLIDLVQLGFAFMALLAVYVAGRKMTLSRRNALMAGFFYFLTPVVILQSRASYIDLAVSSLIWISIAFLFNNSGRKYLWRYMLGGTAMGLFAGAKVSGVLFVGIACLALLLRPGFKKFFRQPVARQQAVILTLVLIPVLLFSGYWYGKNIYVYHNPVWPFKIEIAGKTVFGNGYFTEADVNKPILPDQLAPYNVPERSLFVWREATDGLRYDSFFAGLGPFWFIMGLSALPFFIHEVIRRRQAEMLLPFGVLFIVYLIHPLNWWPRYTQFLVPGGALAFAYLLQYIVRSTLHRVITLAAVFLIGYGVLLSSTETFFTPKTIARWLNNPAKERFASNMYNSFNKPVHASSPQGVLGDGQLGEAYRYIYRHEPMGVSVSISENITSIYPLWGRDLTNRFYFFWPEEYSTWLADLKKKKVRYILVKSKSKTYDFVSMHPRDFRQVFADRYRVYFVYDLTDDSNG